MGANSSRSSEVSCRGDGSVGGLEGQLYVSLRMVNLSFPPAKDELVPHVFCSAAVIGSTEPPKALPMERESASVWDLSFVVPPNHETLDFKFLLKPRYNDHPCIVEEGSNRLLVGGMLEGNTGPAFFRSNGEVEDLECTVFVKADIVSPFDLAASWRSYRENLQPSKVRGIPDVVMNVALDADAKTSSSSGLEFDLEQYVVPTPNASSNLIYAANLTENPRELLSTEISSGNMSASYINGLMKFSTSSEGHCRTMTHEEITRRDSSRGPPYGLTESKSVGTFPTFTKHDGLRELFVDRGVGSPRPAKLSYTHVSASDLMHCESKTMPAAVGAVAAAAVADQMHGSKEDRKLAIVLVGLPARGKTFTAAKLTRYLRWLGHDTKHFNVGKYRRVKHGTNQSADFFRGDNKEGLEARNEVAVLAMEDMLAWMQDGGQVGIFDATNSTRKRRNMLMKMAEGKCKIIFLETICNDESIIEKNISLKVQQSPDYAGQTDFEAGLRDFKERLANYEKVYEPVDEGSYIKMIDMVTGYGGQLHVNNISGYLPGRIVFFLVNTHLTPRPILLTRHGESLDNVRGRIGGDTSLSESGELYAMKLANFIEMRLKSEKTASIWTSTLQRSVLTASPVLGLPKIQWRALDEINAGVCNGMTYEEIKKNMPDEYESRQRDKLRYRYPRGESYLDVIQRLEPVLIELERQHAPVVVISHQAVLRALYAYFADRPLEEIPHIEVPLHTIIEIQMGVSGVQEKRYKLMDSVEGLYGLGGD